MINTGKAYVYNSVTHTLVEKQINGHPTDEQVSEAVDSWLEENVSQETGYVLDRTLTMSNAAAPADLVGDLNNQLSEYERIFTSDVGESVDNWLDAHPEATTTVQDGSLTQAKFSDALKLQAIKDYVTPEMYGAKGDGATDDSSAINTAIQTGLPVVLLGKTYAIANSILLNTQASGKIMFIGSGMNKSILKWTGSSGGVVVKTNDYAQRDTQNTFGVIGNFSISYPYDLLANGSKGIYICEPNARLESIEVRMGNENTTDSTVTGTVGIELDGCTNKGPFPIIQCSVFGQAEKGFYARTSHATFISCATGYTKYGIYIGEDSLGSNANPPYSITIVSYHSYQDKTQCVYIDKAKDILINSIFAECSGNSVFVEGSTNFTGTLTILNSWVLNSSVVTAPNATVYFRDIQKDQVKYTKNSRDSHDLIATYMSNSTASWQSATGDYIIGANNRSINCRGYLKAVARFTISGAGTGTVRLCKTTRTVAAGVYTSDDNDSVLDTKTFTIPGTSTDFTFNFILVNQNWGADYNTFIRVSGNMTISNKQVEMYFYN